MGPLKDIKILEFSGIGPGPFCGMLLADMGADVIRISKKGTEGLENKFDIHNRSKRSIAADLKNQATVNDDVDWYIKQSIKIEKMFPVI